MQTIMFDTMIYDALYENEEVQSQIAGLLTNGCIKIYSTPIQQAQLEAISDPHKSAKKEWCLQFLSRCIEIKPSLFSFDIDGAGFDQGKWATPSEIELYNKMTPKSHHEDKNISVIANEVDVFVTNETKVLNRNNGVRPLKYQFLSAFFNAFVTVV